ncbi:MAG: hypothetical protein KF833_01795 [Verrucomicrobiae bacterium]|nr:hypothetical protein [Verrucomicrobiae bacterium]
MNAKACFGLVASCFTFGQVHANPLPAPAVWGIDPSSPGEELVYYSVFGYGETGVLARFPIPGIDPADTIFGLAGNNDWTLFLVQGERAPQRVQSIHTRSGVVMSDMEFDLGDVQISGLGLWDGAFFAADAATGLLYRHRDLIASEEPEIVPGIVDPRSVAGDAGSPIFTYADRLVDGVPQGEYAIYQIDPLTLEPTYFSVSPSDSIVGMASDYEYLYLSDLDRNLFVYSLRTGGLVFQNELPAVFFALGTTRIVTPDSGSVLIALTLGLLSVLGLRGVTRLHRIP